MNHKVKAHELASERARILVSFGLGHGLTIDQCLENSGITSCHFFEQAPLLDEAKEIRLIQNIIHSTQQSPFALGFEFGRHHQLSLLNKFSPSIFAGGNFSDAISALTASFSALFNLGSFDLSVKMPLLRLVFDTDHRVDNAVTQFLSARNIGLIIALYKQFIDERSDSLLSLQGMEEVGFKFSEPVDSKVLQNYFDCSVSYQQSETFILVNLMTLDFSQPLINAVAAKLISGNCCQPEAKGQVDEFASSSLKDKVWSLLNRANNFSLSKEDAAVQLNMSQRTFSRRLKDEGTNWRSLVSELRMRKARTLLVEGELTLQQISDQTGFSSTSAFSTSFSKANGVNAAEYRRKQSFNPVFQLPDELIGRTKELERLHRNLEKAAGGHTTLTLISGEPGVGKTALTRSFFRNSPTHCRKVLSGKFDQYHKEAPLSSLTLSLNKMIHDLIAAGTADFWRERWLAAIGDQGAVLIERFPQFELILGPQTKLDNTDHTDDYQKFIHTFQHLLKASGSSEHPLVLFIDDLQWADKATIDLLETIMTRSRDLHLLVIGTYRSSEVAAVHPLVKTLTNLQRNGVPYDELKLSDLSDIEVKEFVDTSFFAAGNQLQTLTSLCIEKTQGNPFYLICLLQELVQYGALYPETDNFCWAFNSDKARKLKRAENVVRILESKLSKLPSQDLRVLNIGALLGSGFDYYDLWRLSKHDRDTLNRLIKQLENSGFIKPLNTKYQNVQVPAKFGRTKIMFVHDSILASVIESISKEDILGLQYLTGMYLKERVDLHPTIIFEVVGHLASAEVLLNGRERHELSSLSLMAAKKARLAAAWGRVEEHANYGIRLLGDNCWSEQPELATRLYLILAESLSFLAKYGEANKVYQYALSNMVDPLARARIRALELTQMTIQGQMSEALEAGLFGLSELGVDLRGEREDVAELMATLVEETLSFKDLSFDDLLEKPISRDSKFLAISQLEKGCSPAAFLLGQFHTYALMVLHSATRALQHGYTPGSCLVFAAVAPMLPSKYADYSYRLGKLSLALSVRFDNPTARVESLLVFSLYASSWRNSYRETQDLLREAIRIGSKSGDRLFLSYCPPHLAQLSLFSGRSLRSVDALCDHHQALMSELDVEDNKQILQLTKHTLRKLIDGDAPDGEPLLSGYDCNEARQDNLHQNAFIASTKLFLAVLMRDFDSARNLAWVVLETLPMHAKQFYEPERLFMIGMALVESQDAGDQHAVADCYRQLVAWSDISRDNHFCKQLILKGEIERVSGRFSQARDSYDEAIEHAHEQNMIHLEALAAELAGRMLWSRKKVRACERYLKQAYEQYALWGAGRKLNALLDEFTFVSTKSSEKRLLEGSIIEPKLDYST